MIHEGEVNGSSEFTALGHRWVDGRTLESEPGKCDLEMAENFGVSDCEGDIRYVELCLCAVFNFTLCAVLDFTHCVFIS